MTTRTKSKPASKPVQAKLDPFTNWSRQLVFSLLSRMKVGTLEIITPEQESYYSGDEDSSLALSPIIRVHDNEFFRRCMLYADIGLAESYIDGLIEISSIKDLISWFLVNQHESPVLNESKAASKLINLLGIVNNTVHALRPNSKALAKQNIYQHYDLGNDFFSIFLDPSMTYSSALFRTAEMTLAEAQQAKFERIAGRLKIEASDRVLEVGCGWGAFSLYLAKNYDCSITALTISQEQYDYTRELIKKEKVEHLIDLRLEDYRDHKGSYDKIASIEMIEAVGDKYMDVFIAKLDSLLAKDGVLAMQMITSADSRYEILKSNVDFIQKHIFPGSLLPSLHRVNKAMMSSGELLLVDLFDMTESYVITLKRWQDAFEDNLDKIQDQGFDEHFIRKWKYYFEYCQAAFATRNISVVQATYSRPNNLKLNKSTRSDHAD